VVHCDKPPPMSRRSKPTAKPREFTLDVDAYVEYHCRVFLCYAACGGCANLACAPCERANLRDYASAVRVSVTDAHVRYVRERVKTCWRLPVCDAGRMEKNIPLEKVTDVVLVEPAGGCPPRTLHTVRIQTASNSGVAGAELEIVGLPEADAAELRRQILSRRPGVSRAVMSRT
jgi:hypothetical protein